MRPGAPRSNLQRTEASSSSTKSSPKSRLEELSSRVKLWYNDRQYAHARARAVTAPRRFKIRRDDDTRRIQARVDAETHTEAANLASNLLHGRSYALRMSCWNGRDGVFASLDDKTGEERERFFVEAEDGTGKILQRPTYPPSITHEDAKKLATLATETKAQSSNRRNTKGKGRGTSKRNGKKKRR